jgi:hypothetical protein
MEVVKSSGNGLYVAEANSISAQQVARAAHEELLQLMAQRAEVMKRIGTLKQTIAGLANLFGDQVLNDDLLELIDRKPTGRQPGFTKACRRVLMDVRRPLGAREVCVELERSAPTVLARHKDPLASVTTVLNRLVDYGEARSLNNDRGRRVESGSAKARMQCKIRWLPEIRHKKFRRFRCAFDSRTATPLSIRNFAGLRLPRMECGERVFA